MIAASKRTPFNYYYHGSTKYWPIAVKPESLKKLAESRNLFGRQLSAHQRVWFIVREGAKGNHEQLHEELLGVMEEQHSNAKMIYKQWFPEKLYLYGYELS